MTRLFSETLIKLEGGSGMDGRKVKTPPKLHGKIHNN